MICDVQYIIAYIIATGKGRKRKQRIVLSKEARETRAHAEEGRTDKDERQTKMTDRKR